MFIFPSHLTITMDPSDKLSEEKIRAIVRDELIGTSRTLIGTVFWTILSVFAFLVGLQSFQLALYTPSLVASVGFVLMGVFVVVASLYLLYLLHWE